jgi:hypothetical protein
VKPFKLDEVKEALMEETCCADAIIQRVFRKIL